MTNKQALAYAKHELEYYIQVERDGIRMKTGIEFYEKVVEALEKQEPKKTNVNEIGQRWCPHCANNNTRQMLGDWDYCPRCGQKLRGETK